MAQRDEPPRQSESIPVDIEAYHDEFVITIDLPGVQKQEIDVQAQPDRVVVAADFGDRSDSRYLHSERPSERRSRTIRLPERIDPKRTDARYRNGVLELKLKKRVNTIPVELH